MLLLIIAIAKITNIIILKPQWNYKDVLLKAIIIPGFDSYCPLLSNSKVSAVKST